MYRKEYFISFFDHPQIELVMQTDLRRGKAKVSMFSPWVITPRAPSAGCFCFLWSHLPSPTQPALCLVPTLETSLPRPHIHHIHHQVQFSYLHKVGYIWPSLWMPPAFFQSIVLSRYFYYNSYPTHTPFLQFSSHPIHFFIVLLLERSFKNTNVFMLCVNSSSSQCKFPHMTLDGPPQVPLCVLHHQIPPLGQTWPFSVARVTLTFQHVQFFDLLGTLPLYVTSQHFIKIQNVNLNIVMTRMKIY